MKRIRLPLVAVAGAAVVAGQVIAAPPPPDQPALADSPIVLVNLATIALAIVFLALIAWRRWHRLPALARTPVPFSPLAAVGAFFALMVVSLVGMALAGRLMGVASSAATPMSLVSQARLTLASYGAQAIVLVVIVARLAQPLRRRADAPAPAGRAAATGLATLLIVWPILATAGMVAMLLTGEPPTPVAHETLRLLMDSPRDAWWYIETGLVVVAVPVSEELIYRGVLQPAFRMMTRSAWPAIALTSLLFAAMHIGPAAPHALASLFVLSLGFGWAYEKTGRLLVPIGMHVAFNAGNIAAAMAIGN